MVSLLFQTEVNGNPSKSRNAPEQAAQQCGTGHYGILPLRVRDCLNTAPGLRPAEPVAPAIHPPSKLGGILAVQ